MKHKRLLRIFVAALAVSAIVIAVLVFARSQETQRAKQVFKLGVAIYRGDDTFISNMTNSLKRIAAEHEAEVRLNLSVADAQGRQATQNSQIERFLSLNYDVLCVNLVDRTDAAYIVDRAREVNVPLVFFNREPVQEDLQKWERIYYVGTDAAENGRLQGQIVVDAYKKDPARFDRNGDGIIQYIMLEGESRHQDAVLRTEASVQTLKDAGILVEKLDGAIANWERSQAAALAEQYFQQYGDQIELIICNNDDMALGVIDTCERLELDFTNIVGIDGTPPGLEAVEKKKMLGTVIIDYETQAELIYAVAHALATGQPVEEAVELRPDKSVRAPMQIITQEDFS